MFLKSPVSVKKVFMIYETGQAAEKFVMFSFDYWLLFEMLVMMVLG